MLLTLSWLLALSLAINGILFLIAYLHRSDKLTDISYALTFIALSMTGFLQSDRASYDLLGLALVCIWGVRIGSFLLHRVIRVGKDQRFDTIRENFFKFGKFWLGQAITAWVLMIPLTLAFHANTTLQGMSLVGTAVWLVGFLIETVADAQKFRFSSAATNKGKWIDTGLWRYSRHPNYFGEILVWCGIYLYAAPQLTTTGQVVGLVSPLCITLLLVFVSGIPILEKSADQKWGKLPAYKRYKQRTSTLIPLPKQRQG